MKDYRSLLRSLLDDSIDVIAFKDREGRYLAASRSLYEAFGMQSADDLIGKTDAALWPEDMAARRIADDILVASTGQALGPTEEPVRVGDEIRWASLTKQPLRDDAGDVVGSFMVLRDVTDHKLAELALQEQALQLSVVLETQRLLAQISDLAEAQELICARALDLTGGDTSCVLMREDDLLRFVAGCGDYWLPDGTMPLGSSMAGRALIEQQSIVIADAASDAGLAYATSRGVRSSANVPLKHGGELIGVLQAVAERPDAFGDEQLNALELLAVILSEFLSRTAEAEALARFEAVYMDAPIGIGILDLNGYFTQTNERLVRATGRSEAELSTTSLIDFLHPDDRQSAEADFARLVRGESDTWYEEARMIQPASDVVWVQSAISLVRDASGRPSFAVAMVKDITQQKLAEAALRRQEAETRMHQKLEAVGQLAAGIAHEMNTPMQFVGDSVHFLEQAVRDTMALVAVYREALESADPETRARIAAAEDDADLEYISQRVPAVFERVYSGVERVSSLVKAMKSFAHSSQTEKAPANLNEAIETTLTVARNEYKYVADIELDLGPLPSVHCNVSDLNQVFLNLIVNSAHAIEDARGESERRGTIRISSASEPDEVVLRFADDGCGIPEDVRSRIFDPFFTTKDVGRGSGQGLAIAHNIVVDRHHGSIVCESEVGVGTTITVRLPIGTVRSAESERQAA
jgi:PAS domain S-box-containing protein